jgi:phosphoribosylglycinamide formyltransferase-1
MLSSAIVRPTEQPNMVVLISGSGSNLQALINASANGSINTLISAVISNRPNAYGIERAEQAGLQTHVIDHTLFTSREAFDQELQATIDLYQPDIVVLAGFMRILTAEFTQHYLGRMLNIHPSLLPKYPGLNTHQRALDAGDEHHGVTVHFVTPTLDDGPNILQAKIEITDHDDAVSLAQKIQIQEHLIYPQAVNWLAKKQIEMIDNIAFFEGSPLPLQGLMFNP